MWFNNRKDLVQGKRPFKEIYEVVQKSIPIQRQPIKDKYRICEQTRLGTGATADVWKLYSKKDHKYYVLKQFK